ncbi:hypothetical protein V2W45_643061 [Cenococcum geophilum]
MSDKQTQKEPWHASLPITKRLICELPTTVHYQLDPSDSLRANVPVDIPKSRGSIEHEPYSGVTAGYPVCSSIVPMTTQRPNGPEQFPSTEPGEPPVQESPEAPHQLHSLRFTRHMENATKEQEELAELRERTLTERMKLERKRKQLREIRMKAGDIEAQIITQLREVLEQHNIEFPPKLLTLYNDVQATRDRLGGLEDDYNQAESEYGTLEWTCSNRESKFYRKFGGSGGSSASSETSEYPVLPDGPEAQYSSALGELEMLKEQLSELQREHAEQLEEKNRRELYGLPISIPDASFLKDFPRWEEELQRGIKAAEFKAQQLRDELNPHEQHKGSRRASDSYLPTPTNVSTVRHVINMPQSESALASLVEQFTDKRKRISDWILESLKCSPFERARLKSRIGIDDLDDDAWWELVLQYWNQDEPEDDFAGKEFLSPSASHVTTKAMNPSAPLSMHLPRAGNHAILAGSASNQVTSVRDDAGLMLPFNAEPIAPSQLSPIEDLIIPVSTPVPERVPNVQESAIMQPPPIPPFVRFGKREILEIPSLKDYPAGPKIEVPQPAEPSPTRTNLSTTTSSAPAPAQLRHIFRDGKTAESQSGLVDRGARSDPGRNKQTSLKQLWLILKPNPIITDDGKSNQDDQSQIQRSDSPESYFDNRHLLSIHQPDRNEPSPPPTRGPSPRENVISKPIDPYHCSHLFLISNHKRSHSESSSTCALMQCIHAADWQETKKLLQKIRL